jgi:hypothetical protein
MVPVSAIDTPTGPVCCNRQRVPERIADVVWRTLAFLTHGVLMVFHETGSEDEDLVNARALPNAAEPPGIGHGIHQGAKHLCC